MFARPIHAGPAMFAIIAGVCALVASSLTSCGKKIPARAPVAPAPARIGTTETGIASWYGIPYHGRRSANGEVYDMYELTAAHRKFPFDTWVEVTNLSNKKRVDVRITDRGPFVDGRIIDLSLAAAREIDMVTSGIAQVKLKVIAPPRISRAARAAPPSSEESAHVTEGRAVPKQTSQEPVGTADNLPSEFFSVQAGAFSTRERAEALRDSLGEEFQDVRVVERSPLWLVIAGHALSAEDAAKLAAKVRAKTGESLVVLESALARAKDKQ